MPCTLVRNEHRIARRDEEMKSGSIAVDLRLSTKSESKVKAFADITVSLGDEGTITVLGFSVLVSEGRPPRVMAPARKGKQAWFDTVQLSGKIRGLIEQAVLSEYERQASPL
jgi:DNA-binding cell septation regulator SpoVG